MERKEAIRNAYRYRDCISSSRLVVLKINAYIITDLILIQYISRPADLNLQYIC